MIVLAIFYTLGILCLQYQSSLYAWIAYSSIALSICLFCICRYTALLPKKQTFLIYALSAFALGFSWAQFQASQRISQTLSLEYDQRNITLTGIIADLPQQTEHSWRFDFIPDPTIQGIPPKIRLSWYEPPPGLPSPKAGERWTFEARLRPMHGMFNPLGFDYEAWLLGHNILATGTIKNSAINTATLLDSKPPGVMPWLQRTRQSIRDRFLAILPDQRYTPVLTALAVGDQGNIEPSDWEALRASGTVHLLSISGLHIAMVAWLFGTFSAFIWRLSPKTLTYLPAQTIFAISALISAWAYATLAGLSIPTLRSALMISVFSLAFISFRHVARRDIFALSLILVLTFDPWAVLSAGFWLSFGAVALLIYFEQRKTKTWQVMLYTQLGLSLASMPVLGFLFNQVPLFSALVNIVAIPWVSWIITPLCLLSMLPGLDQWLLPWAHQQTAWLMHGLNWISTLPYAQWFPASVPLLLMLCTLLGILWLGAPRGMPARSLGLVSLLAFGFWTPPRPPIGHFQITSLDVGQGLAVHIQTAQRDLFFDTGPVYGRSSQENNAGERIVLPYLKAHGIKQLDMLILSHADLDHVGGATALLSQFKVETLLSSLPTENTLHTLAPQHAPCHAGTRWEWDGVTFEILWPPEDKNQVPPAANMRKEGHDNNLSCVLRISNAQTQALITGDLEGNAEGALIERTGPGHLQSQLVIAGHHGSKTSSTSAFIEETQAKMVVFSAGFRNNFRHPHPNIVAAWERTGAQTTRTDLGGAIRYDSRTPNAVQTWRQTAARYWHSPTQTLKTE